MPGLSFLVSPQTQDQAAETQRAVLSAYQQEQSAQRQEAAQNAMSDRAEQQQKAAESRQSEREQAMFLMKAQASKDIMDRFEEGQHAKTTTASIAAADKQFSTYFKVKSDLYKDVTDAKSGNKYDQNWRTVHGPEMGSALAEGQSWYTQQKANFSKTAKPGDVFAPDWFSSPLASLDSPRLDPSWAVRPEAQLAEAESKTFYRQQNFNLATRKFGYQMSEPFIKQANQGVYYNTLAETADGSLQDYLRKLPAGDKTPAKLSIDVSYQRLSSAAQQAKNQAAGMNAVLAKNPGVPTDILKMIGSPGLLDRYTPTAQVQTAVSDLPSYSQPAAEEDDDVLKSATQNLYDPTQTQQSSFLTGGGWK